MGEEMQPIGIFCCGKPVAFGTSDIKLRTDEEPKEEWVSDNAHSYEFTCALTINPWSKTAKVLRQLSKIKGTCEYQAKRLPRKKKKALRKILAKCGHTNFTFKFINP